MRDISLFDFVHFQFLIKHVILVSEWDGSIYGTYMQLKYLVAQVLTKRFKDTTPEGNDIIEESSPAFFIQWRCSTIHKETKRR